MKPHYELLRKTIANKMLVMLTVAVLLQVLQIECQDYSRVPLGMSNGFIKNDQITATSQFSSTYYAYTARLKLTGIRWCSVFKSGAPVNYSEYVQVDFKSVVTLTGVATQGDDAFAPNYVKKYYLQVSLDGKQYYDVINGCGMRQLFTGNYRFQNLIVMNLLPVPITTQFLRINPITGGYRSAVKCLRAEVYGYHPVCADDLTLLASTKLSVSSSKFATFANGSIVHSRYAWCANTTATNEYIKVDLGVIRRITGFGIQGDSENDQWPTKVKIGVSNCSRAMTEMTKEYIGGIGRFDVTRHWFKDHVYARYIQFRPTVVNGGSSACMRIQVLGCPNILDYSRVPLGMSNGFIKNDQITATSQYSSTYYAYTARLILTGIRWCSALKSGAPVNYSEYLQVDFKSVVTLTGIATQGDDSCCSNYVKKYFLEVSKDGKKYSEVINACGLRQSFIGNIDHTGIAYAWLTVPTKARFVRFRASNVSGSHICVRVEFLAAEMRKAAGKMVYSLGLESGVIEDSQLHHSGENNGNPAQNGRLHKALAGWCAPNGKNSEWLQIDFKQPMVITAIATQGHGNTNSIDRTYKYYLQYREVGSSAFIYAKNSTNGSMIFTGNYRFQNLIVMNLLPVSVTTRFLRINPIAAGDQSLVRCLQAEVYGYHPVCNDDLTNFATITASSSAETGQNAYIYSPTTWCASSSDGTKYMEMEFKKPRMLTGIGIQGDSDNDHWVKTFRLSHGLNKDTMEDTGKVYIANNDRNSIVRNWLLPPLFTRYFRIRVETFHTSACIRVQLLGCANDQAVLRSINATVINMRKVVVSWDVVYSASSSFILQYRKTEEQTWTEIENLLPGKISLFTFEKYQSYIVRLKSPKGILMLKKNVFGGTFSEAARFKLQIDPRIEPKKAIPAKVTANTVTVFWKQLTQTEILDWDPIGFNIIYKCISDLDSQSCDDNTAKEFNISNANATKFSAENLMQYTNYTFTVSIYNFAAKGPKLTINVKTKMKDSTAPTNVTATAISPTSILLDWEKPTSFNGLLYHYIIRYKTSSDTSYSESINTGNQMRYVIKGLRAFTKYAFQVAVSAKVGETLGNWSLAVRASTKQGVIPKPFLKNLSSTDAESIRISLENVSRDFNASWYRLFFTNDSTKDCSKALLNSVSDNIDPAKLPLTLEFNPGVKTVQGTPLQMNTLGNYTVCYQTVIQEKSQSHASNFVTMTIERKSLEKVDALKFQSETGTNTLTVPLTKGPVNTKSYHVIVIEDSTPPKSPGKWLPSELGPYDASTYTAGKPYIAAVLPSYAPKFLLGDGKEYALSNWERRYVESIIYKNVPLKANTKYLIFQRAYVSQDIFYSSPWLGPLATKADESNTQQVEGNLSATAIISINIAAFIFVFAIIALCVIIMRRRISKQSGSEEPQNEFWQLKNLKENQSSMTNQGYKNEDILPTDKDLAAETISNMEYEEINDGENIYEDLQGRGRENSYKKVIKTTEPADNANKILRKPLPSPRNLIKSKPTNGLIRENLSRNDGWSLVADDASRVVLQQQIYDNVCKSGYINAIYVEGNNHKHEYVATQYPFEDMVSKFWRMIQQEGVQTVVLLTQIKENNMALPIFWPLVGRRACHGEIIVKTEHESSSEEATKRMFTITHRNDSRKEAQRVKMFHFEDWPDKSLPRNANNLLKLVRKVDDLRQQQNHQKPAVVMCRDGGNRTGAFLAILITLNCFKATHSIYIDEIVKKLRSIRPQFMENKEIREFCYDIGRSFVDNCYDKI